MPTDTDVDGEVVLLDTSVAIAVIVEDHELHASALEVVKGRRLGLSGHAWFETYSVLTRLPGARGVDGPTASELLATLFPEVLSLGQRLLRLIRLTPSRRVRSRRRASRRCAGPDHRG